MLEKTERNASICFSFQKYESIRSIAKYLGISEATVREILIRKLGAKLYLEIRKAKIRKTAKKYNYKSYLSKRKIYIKK